MIRAGGDLLSRWTHYHRPRVLIGRVRDGNGSFHPGVAAGKLLSRFRGVSLPVFINGGVRVACVPVPGVPRVGGGRGGAAKRSAVSTGRLSGSPRLHPRPIDPVVSREPSPCGRRPDLGGSFALICLQRLSVPHVATRRCG